MKGSIFKAIVLGVLLISCQPSKIPELIQSFESSDLKVTIDWQTLKYHFPETIHLSSKPGETKIPTEVPFVVTYDNVCRALRGDFQKVRNNSTLPISTKQVFFRSNWKLSDIYEFASKDNCLLNVSNEIPLEINQINDPLFNNQKYLNSIKAQASWTSLGIGTESHSEVTVAILDTGVDSQHPDLKNVMWKSPNGSNGYDFVNNDDDPLDDNSHGTHVAGLAGAEWNNSIGVAGVGGAKIKIMAIKVMDGQGRGYSSQVINGIYYAVQNGAKVINMSLAGFGKSSAWNNALTYAVNNGVTVIVAAGNSSKELNSNYWVTPASYAKNLQGMLAIGSIDSETLSRSGFSNYGPEYVEIGAPGSNGMISTVPSGGYSSKQGTSMSSPVIAGGVGLLLSVIKGRSGQWPTPKTLENLLVNNSPSLSKLSFYFKDGKYLDLEMVSNEVNRLYPSNSNEQEPPPVEEEPPPPQMNSSFVLVDSINDVDINSLSSGSEIDISDQNVFYNVKYNAPSDTSAVVFNLDGRLSRIEYSSPFAFAGKYSESDFRDWQPNEGIFQIEAISYDLSNGSWIEIKRESVDLYAILQNFPPPVEKDEPPPEENQPPEAEPPPTSRKTPEEVPCGRMDNKSCLLFQQINQLRYDQNISVLESNDSCTKSSQYHANNMSRYGLTGEDGPGNTTQEQRLSLFGLDLSSTNELLFIQQNESQVFQTLRSDTNKISVILDSLKTIGGIGQINGYWVICISSN